MTNSSTAGIGLRIDQDGDVDHGARRGVAGAARMRRPAHRRAARRRRAPCRRRSRKPPPAGDDARVGPQAAGDLDAVADAAAGLRSWPALTLLSAPTPEHVAEAVAQHAPRSAARSARVRAAELELAAREHAGACGRVPGAAAGRHRRGRCGSADRPSARPCAPCRRSAAPLGGATTGARARPRCGRGRTTVTSARHSSRPWRIMRNSSGAGRHHRADGGACAPR